MKFGIIGKIKNELILVIIVQTFTPISTLPVKIYLKKKQKCLVISL